MRFARPLFMGILGILAVFGTAHGNQVTIVTGEWLPYLSESLPDSGPGNAVIAAAFKAEGIEAAFKYVPWKRALQHLKTGEALGSSLWNDSKLRASYSTPSAPIVETREVFVFLKGKLPGFDYTDLEALKKYRLAALAGYNHEAVFKKAGLDPDVSNGPETALKKLDRGRVDLMCEDEVVVRTLIARLFPGREDRFGIAKTPLNTRTLHLLFSRQHPGMDDYLERFNAGLLKIKADGTYNAIMGKLAK